MSLLWILLVIAVVVWMGFYVVAKCGEPLSLKCAQLWWVVMGIIAEGIVISFAFAGREMPEKLLFGVFAGCLIFACITDVVMCQVYCFVWWVGMFAGVLLLWAFCGRVYLPTLFPFVICNLLIFGLLQYGVFSRTYGKADCHAFFTCALVETALGIGMEGYLLHMILAYVLLIVHQLKRKNVSKYGKLLYPVPFLPYITPSFWIMVLVYRY